jgi:transketolase
MRNAFIDELMALAGKHPNVALIVGDLGFSVVEPFAERFPDRFINAGVAEQNMMGLAAGMASEGYHVFVYSIANFPTFRCAEQIRNDVAYHQLPVTVVAVGGGLAYGALGYSHHAVQDYGLLRLFPNMLIAAPGDPMEVRACLRHLVANPQPSYLRLGKAGEPSFHQEPPELSPGVWLTLRPGQEGSPVLLSTGAALTQAMSWSQSPAGPALRVCSLPLWGMSCKGIQAAQVASAERLITVEDHLRDGGFGSWMGEALMDHPGLRAAHHAIALDPAVCGRVGGQEALNQLGGLTLDALARCLHHARGGPKGT